VVFSLNIIDFFLHLISIGDCPGLLHLVSLSVTVVLPKVVCWSYLFERVINV
jgi:hypothetical protein